MMKALLVALILLSAYKTNAQLVHLNSVWRYYDLAQAPPNQSGVNWKQPAYDHTSWSSGAAQLGYGDADEATIISSSTLTGYFRQNFTVNDISDYSGLTLQLTYDDGAVVYLNGTEVWRVNMPSGNINYNTYASSNSGDNVITTTSVANTLVNGTNLIAVEIHQHSASSSDLSFDFSITGVPAGGTAIITRGPYLQSANDTSVIVR